jgi:hypothetical protein
MKQRAVDNTEDGRIPTDPQRQRNEHGKRETGIPAKGP